MKILIIIQSLILFFLVTCSSPTPPNKNLVESKTLRYKYVFGKLDSTGTLQKHIIFNKHGKDSILELYDDFSVLLSRTIFYYDSTGKNIKQIEYNPAGELQSKTEYNYSENGYILEKSTDDADGGYHRNKYMYNDKWKLAKEIYSAKWYFDYLDKWLTSEHITIYLYNDKGYCIGEKKSEDGKPFKMLNCIYDSLGRKIVDESYPDNPREFKYDKLGNQIEELSLRRNRKLVWRWVSVYDSNNILVEYRTFNSLNEPTEVLKTEFVYK